jgi:ribosomal subunit interface protein
MEIIIKTKNLELTESLELFIREKIGGLSKFAKVLQKENYDMGKDPIEFFVEIEKETKHHKKGPYFKAKAEVALPGKILLAISEKDDLLQAIVEVKDEMQQEIKKYKSKTTEIEIRKQKKNKINI